MEDQYLYFPHAGTANKIYRSYSKALEIFQEYLPQTNSTRTARWGGIEPI